MVPRTPQVLPNANKDKKTFSKTLLDINIMSPTSSPDSRKNVQPAKKLLLDCSLYQIAHKQSIIVLKISFMKMLEEFNLI